MNRTLLAVECLQCRAHILSSPSLLSSSPSPSAVPASPAQCLYSLSKGVCICRSLSPRASPGSPTSIGIALWSRNEQVLELRDFSAISSRSFEARLMLYRITVVYCQPHVKEMHSLQQCMESAQECVVGFESEIVVFLELVLSLSRASNLPLHHRWHLPTSLVVLCLVTPRPSVRGVQRDHRCQQACRFHPQTFPGLLGQHCLPQPAFHAKQWQLSLARSVIPLA